MLKDLDITSENKLEELLKDEIQKTHHKIMVEKYCWR